MSLFQRGLLVLASLPWTDGILSLVSWGTKQFGSRRKLCHDLWLRSSRKEAFLERFSLLTSSPYVLNMSAVLLMKCDKERIIARDILNSQMLLSWTFSNDMWCLIFLDWRRKRSQWKVMVISGANCPHSSDFRSKEPPSKSPSQTHNIASKAH